MGICWGGGGVTGGTRGCDKEGSGCDVGSYSCIAWDWSGGRFSCCSWACWISGNSWDREFLSDVRCWSNEELCGVVPEVEGASH